METHGFFWTVDGDARLLWTVDGDTRFWTVDGDARPCVSTGHPIPL